MPNYKFDEPTNLINIQDRARSLLNELGIGKEEWCERTGFSEGQYYRWLGSKPGRSKTTSNTAQFMHACAVFDWSPTYLYFGLGPVSLSECANAELKAGIDTAIETNLLVKKMLGMLKGFTSTK